MNQKNPLLQISGRKGIKALYDKYGREQFREWRRQGYQKVKHKLLASNPKMLPKNFILPEKPGVGVSEFIGVYLGDGTLTDYFVRITGDVKFDRRYFEYLQSLVYRSFGLDSAIRSTVHSDNLILEIRSKLLCDYLKSLGLKTGNKILAGSVIPEEIAENRDLFYSCFRGLNDTDGFVGKDGKVLAIRFYNKNKFLMGQLKSSTHLKDLFGIRSQEFEIGSRNQKSIDDFFERIGSSNPRHIIRYLEARKGNLLAKPAVLDYYEKYSDLQLPFIAKSNP